MATKVAILVKLAEPKPFTSAKTQVGAWFSALKPCFVAV